MGAFRLGDVLDVQSGFAFKKECFSSDDGIPLIRIRDLDDSSTEINYRGEYRDDFIVDAGDYLIGMDGSFRCYRWRGGRALLNQRVCRLRNFKEAVEPEYIYYGIQKKLADIEETTSFVTVKHISAKQIQNIELPLRSTIEQRRIVDILSRAEGIVRLRRDAEKKAAELIPALFSDMFGDPATNPKGWLVSNIGDISIRVTKGESPKWQGFEYGDNGVRFVTSENVLWGSIDLEKKKHVPETFHQKLKRSALSAGDVLINLVGASVGRAAIVPAEALPANINQAVAVTTLDKKKCIPEFLLAQVLSASTQTKLLGNVVEAARANISLANIRDLQIMLPPLDAQASFANRIEQVRSIQSQQSVAAAKAQATFDTLLAQTFASA